MRNKSVYLFIFACMLATSAFAQKAKDSTSQNVKVDDFHIVFTKAEKPSTFPGGMDGWRKYLEQNLKYPEKAQEKGIQGVIRVQLVVTKEGHVTQVKALNNPGGGLAKEAERVIKEGPDWVPAEQNNKKVAYRFVQTITFQLM